MDAQLTLVWDADEAEAFVRWLRQVADRTIACDTETGGLDWWRYDLRLVQFGDAEHGWAIPWDRWSGLVHEAFDFWQGNILFHNAKFDLHFLEHNGVKVPRHQVHDTMYMRRAVSPHLWQGLKPTAADLIHPDANAGEKELKRGMMKHGWGWHDVPILFEPYWQYAALDPVLTYRIGEILYPELIRTGARRAYDTDMACALVVMDMERRGQRVDTGYCQERSWALSQYEEELLRWAHVSYGLESLSKDKALVSYLQRQGANLHRLTDKGRISLDKDALLEVGREQPTFRGLTDCIIAYRQTHKQRVTYFDAWLEFNLDELIHSSFNITGARTARMSSERPNLQNVPRKRDVRWALVPSEGNKLILADYDQIELRIMACRAGEDVMIQAINAGEDFHAYTAKLVYGVTEPTKEQRRIAKHSNFAKIYGAGVAKFALTAGITEADAAIFVARYEEEFPRIVQFAKDVDNLPVGDDGNVRAISPYVNRLQVASEAYKLVNYLIQGEAGDVLKTKLIELDSAGYGPYMTVPIHDEIAFDVPADEALEFAHSLPEVMEDRTSYPVPLTVGVEVVDRWGEKYDDDDE